MTTPYEHVQYICTRGHQYTEGELKKIAMLNITTPPSNYYNIHDVVESKLGAVFLVQGIWYQQGRIVYWGNVGTLGIPEHELTIISRAIPPSLQLDFIRGVPLEPPTSKCVHSWKSTQLIFNTVYDCTKCGAKKD
jgi:hypothetical protein